ncbi:MAG: hypothetical protein KTR14_11735 [Vampirovibrio sp.]|nr:hypothetical protein [Vampirovibrio sp.]
MEQLVCPILSIRHPEIDELCLTEKCALYLPSAKKCAVAVMGIKNLMEAQQLQKPSDA